MSNVTMSHIAEVAGVSQATVSFVLNERERSNGSIGPETKKRVQETARELGYQPNRSARALATGRTYQIALCVPTLNNPFHAEFIRHFEAFARNTPYDLLIATTLDKQHALAKLAVDGMLLHHSIALPAHETSCPLVLLQSPPLHATMHGAKPFDQVLLGLSDAARAVMAHLLEQQAKRIAFVSPDGMLIPEEPRYVAYLQATQMAGMKPEIIALDYQGDEGLRPLAHAVLQEYFGAHGFPDALFCCNDEIAIGAYRALHALQRRIPHETRVVGCGRHSLRRRPVPCPHVHPPPMGINLPERLGNADDAH